MTKIQTEVFEAFQGLGVSQDAAMKAAAALSARDEEFMDVKSDVRLLKWMVGLLIGMILPMFLKQFVG